MPSFTSIISTGLIAISSVLAYTTPTTFNQTLDPIFTPALGQRVPVSKPFKITWGPNSSGTVTLVLLRGPAENIQPLYSIAEKIPNSGSYTWTPKSDLEDDVTHYGLQLIEDSNGQFQYSVQFGISNPDYHSSSSSAVATSTVSASSSAAVTSAPVLTGYTSAEPTTSSYVTVSHTIKSSITSLLTVTTRSASEYSTKEQTSTAAAQPTTTIIVTPTYGGNATVPTGTGLPVPSPSGNSAGAVKVASGMLVGVFGVAALLL